MDDRPRCEIPLCNNLLQDVHHIIPRSKFGKKRKDEQDKIENLVGLCRDCHNKADANVYPDYELKRIHEIFMKIHGKSFT